MLIKATRVGMCLRKYVYSDEKSTICFTDLESPHPIWHQGTYIIQSEHDTSIELHVPLFDATNYVV